MYLFLFHLCVPSVLGFTKHLNSQQDVFMPPSQYWYCALTITIFYFMNLCSILFILSMTFDHFYSIIRPHKATSFNTVKRAKITIVCIVIFSVLYNIPHLYTTAQMVKVAFPLAMPWQVFLVNSMFGFHLCLNLEYCLYYY